MEFGSGTHPTFANVRIKPPTITSGSAALTNAANLLVSGGGPSAATNNYIILDDTNTAYLSTGGVWTDTSARAAKMGILGADASELLAELRTLQVHKYQRRQAKISSGEAVKTEDGETVYLDTPNRGDPFFHYGLIADEVPESFKDVTGKGVAAGYVAGFLVGVVQDLDRRLVAAGL